MSMWSSFPRRPLFAGAERKTTCSSPSAPPPSAYIGRCLSRICLCAGRFFFFQAEDGIRDAQESRGLGDVYKRQPHDGSFTKKDGRFAYKWVFETADDSGILLILKKGQELLPEKINLINHSIDILAECLRRGLEYEDLFERASNDALTGLSNRRVFNERIYGMID